MPQPWDESEAETRRDRVDPLLNSAGWKIVRFAELEAAVEELNAIIGMLENGSEQTAVVSEAGE